MKTPRIHSSARSGFTLIELLVVITIIVLLAGMTLAVGPQVLEKADRTKAVSDGRQIGTAIKLFAADFNGDFPMYTDPIQKSGDPQSSNEILATIITQSYLKDEKSFNIPKSAYCRPGPDNDMTPGHVLEAGECGWAYVRGLNETSDSRLPLLVNGFVPGGVTYNVRDKSAPGGLWSGEYAVVIRVDNSAAPEKTIKRGNESWVKRDGKDPNKNAFAPETTGDVPWLAGKDIKILNPRLR